MELLVLAAGKALRWVFHTAPGFVCRTVPHAHETLSLASLYVFVQALGLLWVFLVSLLAVICTRILTAVMAPGGEEAPLEGGAAPLLERPGHAMAVCYVYYCVVRITGLFGRTMWVAAWEIYHDFPTMRHMLIGRRKSHSSAPPSTPAVERQASEASPVTGTAGAAGMARGLHASFSLPSGLGRPASSPKPSPRAAAPANGDRQQGEKGQAANGREAGDHVRRQAVLVTPLIVLVMLNCAMLLGQLYCEGRREDDACQDLIVFDPTGRINRNTRFVLFLAMMQWLQAWTGLFPSWYVSLTRDKNRLLARGASSFMTFLLVPSSMLRLSIWFVKPAGIGVVQHVLGLRHHLIDSVLVAGWSLWLLVASFMVVQSESLKHSGFKFKKIRDDATWKHLCGLFKYTLFFWQGAHFLRGCVALGPAHAQSDLIAITVLYPMLLCFIWTVTFVVVALSRFEWGSRLTLLLYLTGASSAVGLSWLVCAQVGRGNLPLLGLCVCLHLCRQAFRILRRWIRGTRLADGAAQLELLRRHSIKFSVDPHKHKELRRTYSLERRLCRMAIRVLLLILVSFVSILGTCILMAGLQQRKGFFVEDVVWWRQQPGGVEIVNSGASILTLIWPNGTGRMPEGLDPAWAVPGPAGPAEGPHYAVCGHTWHGLQLADYALLSLAAYVNADTKNELPKLLEALLPHKQVSIRRASSNHRRWLELEVKSCGPDVSSCRVVTVVSVSGTDPTRIMDYAENLRMWTEPVALQILSTLFPTVRILPRDTTAMIIVGIHSILKSIALEDDQWHYKEILEHVRQMPRDREVVLTGHSLGGGMALVIGALTNRLAVAIQPPGVYNSLAKHQTQQSGASSDQVLHRRSVSLVIEGDWIQNFDGHGGLVQTMNCDQSEKSIAVGCHLLEGALCHLLRHCGDQASRFAACKHTYAPTSTALTVARAVVAFLRESWQSSFLLAKLDSVAMVGVTVSAVMVAKYGAPSLPRSIFLTLYP